MKTKDTILSLLRHALTFGGGLLVGKGLLTESALGIVVPAIMTVVGTAWGAYDEFRAANAPAASSTPPAAA